MVADKFEKKISHILFDAAKMEVQINAAIEANKTHESLYESSRDIELSAVGPYLFAIEDELFEKWCFNLGWRESWGTFLSSNASFDFIRAHFRKFLLVKTEEGKRLYFRFYDPRVLRIFLPACDQQQLKEFFGPIESFICEDEDPTYALIFSLKNNELVTERVIATDLFDIKTEETKQEEVLQPRQNVIIIESD